MNKIELLKELDRMMEKAEEGVKMHKPDTKERVYYAGKIDVLIEVQKLIKG